MGIIGDIMQRGLSDALLALIRISDIEITVYDTTSAFAQDARPNMLVV